MQLTDADIERFREAYREGYGEDLPMEEARVWAVKLVRLYSLLLSPTPDEQAERLANSAHGATMNPKSPALVERETPTSIQ